MAENNCSLKFQNTSFLFQGEHLFIKRRQLQSVKDKPGGSQPGSGKNNKTALILIRKGKEESVNAHERILLDKILASAGIRDFRPVYSEGQALQEDLNSRLEKENFDFCLAFGFSVSELGGKIQTEAWFQSGNTKILAAPSLSDLHNDTDRTLKTKLWNQLRNMLDLKTGK